MKLLAFLIFTALSTNLGLAGELDSVEGIELAIAKQSPLLQPSLMLDHDVFQRMPEGLSIDEYIRSTYENINAIRSRHITDGAGLAPYYSYLPVADVARLNSPFEVLPKGRDCKGPSGKYKKSILMVHGLTDSSYLFRDFAQAMSQSCFRVLVILLPGHGTQSGDLVSVSYEDWQKVVEFGFVQLLKDSEEVSIAGQSTGATLALDFYLNGKYKKNIKHLFLFSSALRLNKSKAEIFAAQSLYRLGLKYVPGPLELEDDPVKYTNLPLNAVLQLNAIMDRVNEAFSAGKTVDVPVYAVSSIDDSTIDVRGLVDVQKYFINPHNIFRYYTGSTPSELDVEAKPNTRGLSVVFSELIQPLGQLSNAGAMLHTGGPQVASSSHIGIVVAPENKHYGEDGDYKVCNQYWPAEFAKYQLCLNGQADMVGETSKGYTEKGTVQRLSFNPLFYDMVNEILSVVEQGDSK